MTEVHHGLEGVVAFDLRHVEPLVEHVDGEQAVHPTVPQPPQGAVTVVAGRLPGDRLAGDAGRGEHPRHVLGVRDRDAEPERPHRGHVGDLGTGLADDLGGAGVVAGVEAVEGDGVVAAALPLDPGEVDVVGDPEVVEGHQQVRRQRIPQAQFGGGTPLEEQVTDVDAVGAFGGRGQTQELGGPQVVEQRAVGGRGRVVELVDHDDVEVVGRDVLHPVGRQ